MAYNLPSYSTERFSFGPGVLYIGAAGQTPTTDVGAVRTGASLRITREVLEVPQGSPRTIVQRYVTSESVQMSVTGIEWNLDNLAQFLGVDITTSTPSLEQLDFGGLMSLNAVSLKFVHQTPEGHTIEVDVWRAQGSGEIEISFGDDVHEFPYTFNAIESDTDWSGNSLTAGQRLCRIKYIKS